MLSSVISALSGQVDSKFLIAYWLPAFVAVLGGIGILGARVGPQQLDEWVNDLDSVEQSLGTLIVLVLITMLAFVLRALTRPITAGLCRDRLAGGCGRLVHPGSAARQDRHRAQSWRRS